MARSIGAVIGDRLGQPVVVQSKPGASGQIAAQTLLQAPADGYTLLVADNATLGIAKAVYRSFNHDPQTDFVPIAPMMLMPMVLYVARRVPSTRWQTFSPQPDPGRSTSHRKEMRASATYSGKC